MPELPEIETLKNSLEQKLIGLAIKNIEQKRDNLRYKLSSNLAAEILYANILIVRRRAKYLIIDLNNGYSLIVHLGMSGRFTLQPYDYKIKKHDHIILDLTSNEKLVFNDARRFGMIYSYETRFLEEKFFNNLAIEPLSDLLTSEYLKSKLINRKVPIKNLLMDNKIIVGVGNIYASESLFLAKINPSKLGADLTLEEITKLTTAIKTVLAKAILAGGTTLKDFVSGDNNPGYFKQQLAVYNREDKKCLNCDGIIIKLKQSGRSSFYCSACQK
ncbi:bifunctional DNA-formamidopyrimidine glycosylase/DNA-(apurinic or apyrimidinic site) lyase [Rickettsia endosymbiont of Halotydeus destructor]|uniref:bifunctional DNA-formamidopyrimidine glycosylase/DNA-(apurinic or apyrimidinic site) lyase n=1 Tax=Rickettsia endosymbiont of Halotydeus destructor TaxID=2996754 RepID=UPI003BB175BD